MKKHVNHIFSAILVAAILAMSLLGIATAEPFVRPEGMTNVEAMVLIADFAGIPDEAVTAILEAAEQDAEAEPVDVVYKLAALTAARVVADAEYTASVTALAVVLNHYDTATAANGSKDNAVKDMQALLGCTADGKFGPKTEAALKAFQAAVGLPETGVYTAADKAVLHDDGDHVTALIDAILALMNSAEAIEAKTVVTMANQPTAKPETSKAPASTDKPAVTTAPTATAKPAAAPAATTKPTAAPTATAKPTTAPTAKPTTAPTATPKPTATPHTYQWEDVTETVNVPEKGHYETKVVVDQEAYDEQVWVVDKKAWMETVCDGVTCNSCGRVFPSTTAWTDHIFNDGCPCRGTSSHHSTVYHDEQGHWETKQHDAVTHTEQMWVMDVPAHTETKVVGQKCSSCGATK